MLLIHYLDLIDMIENENGVTLFKKLNLKKPKRKQQKDKNKRKKKKTKNIK